MLKTPFGNVNVLFDSKAANITVQKLSLKADRICTDIEYTYFLSYEYQSDNAAHTLTCTLDRSDISGDAESGEHLDAISFYIGGGKLTIGCTSDFGTLREGDFDFDGEYLKNGLRICIFPNTESRTFTFGVSWLLNATSDNEIQTWFASDPSIYRRARF